MPTQNDIPVAQRLSDPKRLSQKPVTSNPVARSLQAVPWWGYGLAVLAFLSPIVSTRIWFALNAANSAQVSAQVNVAPSETNQTVATDSQAPQSSVKPNLIPFTNSPSSSQNPPSSSATSAKVPSNSPEASNAGNKDADAPPDLFGHHPYQEAPASQLRTIGRASDGYEIRLREAAAKNFLNMQAAAKAEGVDLAVISGFRTIAEQQQLFFDISKQRNQTPAQRAKVSAPPGHSEHHTGYAVDIGDGDVPSATLSTSFEKTAAFQWLQNNAAKYGFEMSFPPNNTQGVMYEPWHWRFVGDDDSLVTFYKKQNRGGSSFIKR